MADNTPIQPPAPQAAKTSATASAPWFTLGPNAQGQNITSQRSALNQAVNGLASDLSTAQSALNALVAAINALPSHA